MAEILPESFEIIDAIFYGRSSMKRKIQNPAGSILRFIGNEQSILHIGIQEG